MTKREFIGNVISELSPIATFVVLSEIEGFETGLKGLILVSALSFGLSWFIERRIPKFGMFAGGIILFFGMLSIILDDPFYIIIKDTLFYASFGTALIVGQLMGRLPFKMLFGEFFALTENGWRMLSIRWAIFFILLTLGNEAARHFLEPDNWVLYKLLALATTWVFGFYQFNMMSRERLPEANKWGMRMR